MMTNQGKWEAEIGWILEAVPEARIVVNLTGHMVFVNRPTEAWFGYRREELIGQKVEVLVPERHRSAHSANRAGFISQPRPRPMGASLELHVRRKDGSEFPVDISLWPLERGGVYPGGHPRYDRAKKAASAAETGATRTGEDGG